MIRAGTGATKDELLVEICPAVVVEVSVNR
jgi:hypothetical protein